MLQLPWCVCACVCVHVARVKSKSFVLHKSAGSSSSSSSDVRTNRAALCCSWLQREGETGERDTERGRAEPDSSCQASIAHLSHRK